MTKDTKPRLVAVTDPDSAARIIKVVGTKIYMPTQAELDDLVTDRAKLKTIEAIMGMQWDRAIQEHLEHIGRENDYNGTNFDDHFARGELVCETLAGRFKIDGS